MANDRANSSTVRARIWWSLFVHPGDRVAGALVDDLGPRKAARVLTDSADPRVVIRRDTISHISAEELAKLRHRYPHRPTRERVDHTLGLIQRHHIHVSTPEDAHWPESLNDLGPHRPLVLFHRGDQALTHSCEQAIALVGTRKPSIEGARAARVLTEALATTGSVTVSGGALGIDGIVHRQSLRHHAPTILVAATSLDRVYPREHYGLFEAVANRGLLLSETPPGAVISPSTFLARNRIIAALAGQTIVVECPIRSGALNTASHAATLGRQVWAVSYAVATETNSGYQRLIDEWGAEAIPASRMGEAAVPSLHNPGLLAGAV